MKWRQAVKQKVSGQKYPTLTRIKIGKALSVIAALPLFTSWLFIFSIPLMMPLSFNVWTKMKINDFKEWRNLR